MPDVTAPPDLPLLLVVGDGPVSESLASMAELLGWRALLADSMAEVDTMLPGASAVVVTSHHADVDGPAIRAALRSGGRPVYVAAMGSRRTQERRREWLLSNDLSATDLERLHAPAGLDIGADSPAEIALAILAELVATRRGAIAQGSLKDRGGPIHPDLSAGEAACPGG
jgi:xanthine/CO dehydrogenase XdhC/CoxF family maturation factor